MIMLIKNLSFKFDKKSNQFFFNNLTIEFSPYKVHFIQGDNGVGKSTLFHLIQGTVPKSAFLETSITLDGTTYTTHNNLLPHAFTQQVSTVQQQYDRMIANQFTFMENLQLACLPAYPTLQSLPHATLFDSIKLLNIDLNKPVHLLSGGQRQLLAILMALQKPTKLLLLDEPTATLDKKNAYLVMQCLHQLAAQLKVTMLIICHDKELIESYAQGNSFSMRQLENGERILRSL
jgi:ABC-type lipoprotein export system ATPase subunit